LTTSFKEASEIFVTPPTLIPRHLTANNYLRLIEDNFARFTINSLLYTGLAIFIALLFASLAAYVLARFKFRGSKAVIFLFLMTLITPYMAVLVPLMFMMTKIHFTNNRLTLPVIYAAQSIPFAAWFLKGYFEMIPESMEKAALVDGYSRIEVLWKVLIPVSMPAIISVSVFVALTSWNDYIVAIFMLSKTSLQTLPVAMFYYLGTHGREWGPLSAAAIVSIVPIVGAFIVFRKYFIGGLLSGAIKG
jgi:ABC-type glycerol-3-phosphate transport system permease component